MALIIPFGFGININHRQFGKVPSTPFPAAAIDLAPLDAGSPQVLGENPIVAPDRVFLFLNARTPPEEKLYQPAQVFTLHTFPE